MNLYLLKRKEGLPRDDDPWIPWYDKCFSLVVRAENEEAARALADEKASHDFDENPWLNLKYSTCELLTGDGEKGVVIANVQHS